jgi:glycosyltransferase involved in cell wall biosynthesis
MPAHNEEHRIDRTLREYRAALPGPEVRFWVALDGCVDGTAAVVQRHSDDDPRVGWVEFPKLGKGGVLAEAFRFAATEDAELIGFVDADGATPPAELARLADVVSAGADGAIASRRHPSAVTPGSRSLARRLTSAGFAFGIRHLFDVRCADTQCGAKVLRADVVRRVAPLLSSRDFLFDVDLLHTAHRLGYQVAEVPTVWVDREGSRLRAGRDARRMLWSSLRLWLHHRVMPIEGHRDETVHGHPPVRHHLDTVATRAGQRARRRTEHERERIRAAS